MPLEAEGSRVAEILSSVPGVLRVIAEDAGRFRAECDPDCRAEAASALVERGVSLRRLGVLEPSLDAIYARYFEGASHDLAAA